MDRVHTSISSLPRGNSGWTDVRLRIRAILAYFGFVSECVWFIHDQHLPRLLAVLNMPGRHHRSWLRMPFLTWSDNCLAVFQYQEGVRDGYSVVG